VRKKELLRVPAIILITVPLGFLLWFFWRRTKSRADEERSRHLLAAGRIVVDEVGTAMVDAGPLQEFPCKDKSLKETEEEPAKNIDGCPEKSHAGALQAEVCLEFKGADSELSGEAHGTKTMLGGETEQSKGLPHADSDRVPFLPSAEPEHPVGIASLKSESSAEDKEARGTADSIVGDGLQGEPALAETSVAEAAQRPEEGLTEAIGYLEEEQVSQQGGPDEKETESAPQRYRPPPQKAPRQTVRRAANQESQRAAPPEVSLDIHVRLTFDRSGFCAMGLLPERNTEQDTEVAVKLSGVPLLLMAQEDWYQDLYVENIGDYLRQGVELRGVLTDGRSARWLLTGRDLYVLASHPRAHGFVSTNRLSLGRSHVVLCGVDLLREVEKILNEAGCEGYTKLDESHGVPSGWIGLRNVMPTKAIALNLGSDPFYAVKPAPDIEIDLEGGVRLRNAVWLAGYPPRVKLFGESIGAVRVLIDGKEAQTTAEGFVIADGYDTSGHHSVYCEGLSCSCSYSIEEPPDSWEEWPAYQFSQADICGPLVQLTPETLSGRPFTGPMSNPLLLGAKPGQVFWCSPRRVALWKGFVPFDVVWALPAQPLRCDKKTARILQFSNAPVAPFKPGKKPALVWSNAILDASRKGLRIEKGDPDSTSRWRDYKKAARNIWRSAR
jgi:hypothetical protein